MQDEAGMDILRNCYSVEYIEGYEPFVVVAKKDLPRFEERFAGYGYDKVFNLCFDRALYRTQPNSRSIGWIECILDECALGQIDHSPQQSVYLKAPTADEVDACIQLSCVS